MDDRVRRLEAARDQIEAALSGTVSARDIAALVRELRATLAELAALAPTSVEVSTVDQITARRAARKARASADGGAAGCG